jgi:hypothetical protein
MLSLMLVVLLPGVGLAIYVFGARPKVVAVASAGRAANLPFERFGDRQARAAESTRSIQALAAPTTLGSFGERRPARTVAPGGPTADDPAGGGFFQDPDLVTVGGPTVTARPVAPVVPTVTATEEPAVHIPVSLGRPYHPRQRTSLEGDDSLATVAAQILGATRVPPEQPAPTPTPRGTSFQLSQAPVATARTPEIFRPRPDQVAPLAAGGTTAVSTLPTRVAMAARWLPDPTGRHQYRFWDGGSWTENVYDAGVESRDPVTDGARQGG